MFVVWKKIYVRLKKEVEKERKREKIKMDCMNGLTNGQGHLKGSYGHDERIMKNGSNGSNSSKFYRFSFRISWFIDVMKCFFSSSYAINIYAHNVYTYTREEKNEIESLWKRQMMRWWKSWSVNNVRIKVNIENSW